MLRVKLLESGARLPVVAHPGEDLGYDVFSVETILLEPHKTVRVRTGISVEARHPETGAPLGLLVRDRSSMASKGIATTAGVIDAGYRGEVQIVMTNLGATVIEIKAARNCPDDSSTGAHRLCPGSRNTGRVGTPRQGIRQFRALNTMDTTRLPNASWLAALARRGPSFASSQNSTP